MKLFSLKTAVLFAMIIASPYMIPRLSFGNVSLVDNDQWKVNLSGFIKLDSITDSTRSFNEVVGNAPVLRTDGANGTLSSSGAAGRDQLSIRNTRFALTVLAPDLDGWSNMFKDFSDPIRLRSASKESDRHGRSGERKRHTAVGACSCGWQCNTFYELQ